MRRLAHDSYKYAKHASRQLMPGNTEVVEHLQSIDIVNINNYRLDIFQLNFYVANSPAVAHHAAL